MNPTAVRRRKAAFFAVLCAAALSAPALAAPAASASGVSKSSSGQRQQQGACTSADESFDSIVRDFERQIDLYLRGASPRPVPRYQFNTFRDRLRQLEQRTAKACPDIRSVIQEILDWTEENIAID